MTNIIIANGMVLTCDVANKCGRYNIVVGNGRILDMAERLETLTKDHPHAIIIDARDKLIVPGFVNAHYHGVSFLFREATSALHYGLWKGDPRLNQALSKFVHPASLDDVRRAYQAAYLAHLRSGTTCVAEFPPSLDESGFTKMLEGIAPSGITPVVALQNWDQIRKTQAIGAERARCVVSLGEEEEFTVYSFEHLSKAAKEIKAPLLAHIAETKDDAEIVRQNFQRDSITLLNSFNALHPTTVLVHANYITEDEVRMVKNTNGGVVVCARSTALKQTGYPSLRHLAKHNVRLCLGTDWGSVDMIEELRFVYHLPLIIAGIRQFSPVELLRMATIDGARTLGVANELGSIEPDKRADIVFFDIATIRLPVVQTHSATDWSRLLVEHLSTADISDVMVNGEFKVRNREMTEVGERIAGEEFRTLVKKYFVATETASAHQQQQPLETNTKVLPFSSDRVADEEHAESFETGFVPSKQTGAILDISERPSEPHPPSSLPKPKRDPVKPELPKGTRRIFGDEEEF